MDKIALIIMLAVVAEALVEYGKSIGKAFADRQAKTAITQLCAVAIGILLCSAAGADMFAAVGIELAVQWLGAILTGIFVSRGANYASDLVSSLMAWKKNKNT